MNGRKIFITLGIIFLGLFLYAASTYQFWGNGINFTILLPIFIFINIVLSIFYVTKNYSNKILFAIILLFLAHFIINQITYPDCYSSGKGAWYSSCECLGIKKTDGLSSQCIGVRKACYLSKKGVSSRISHIDYKLKEDRFVQQKEYLQYEKTKYQNLLEKVESSNDEKIEVPCEIMSERI